MWKSTKEFGPQEIMYDVYYLLNTNSGVKYDFVHDLITEDEIIG